MKGSTIVLEARFTPDPLAEPRSGLGTLTAWCPHCERLHYHGAAGRGSERRIETRGAHCDHAIGSPAAGSSYALEVVGSIATPGPPRAPMSQLGQRLLIILRDHGMKLRRALFHAVVGHGAEAIHHGPGDIAGFRIGPFDLLTVKYGRTWQISEEGSVSEGHGLFGLLAMLFSISPGIAGRRVLEAMSGTQFPAAGALEIERLLDRLLAADGQTR